MRCDPGTLFEPQDCMLLILELCVADSNKLIGVAETCVPTLADWISGGNIVEQLVRTPCAALAHPYP